MWQDGTFYFATSSMAVNASEARTLCQQQGGQLSSVHRDAALLIVHRLLQSLVVAPSLRIDAGAFGSAGNLTAMRFWTVGRHVPGSNNVSSASSIYWDDGSQFRLGARNLTVERPGGCLALDLTLPGLSDVALTVMDCADQAFPLCTYYPAGKLCCWLGRAIQIGAVLPCVTLSWFPSLGTAWHASSGLPRNIDAAG